MKANLKVTQKEVQNRSSSKNISLKLARPTHLGADRTLYSVKARYREVKNGMAVNAITPMMNGRMNT